MKPGCFLHRVLSMLIVAGLLLSAAAAQVKKGGLKNAADINRLSLNQQDALELLKTLARNLKSEPDKLAAAILQAQIADVVWQFDEAFARDVFSWSFQAVSRPAPGELAESARTAY